MRRSKWRDDWWIVDFLDCYLDFPKIKIVTTVVTISGEML